MELERRAKLRRLERFRRRVPHVTQAALVEILAAVLDAAFRECPAFRAFWMASHAAEKEPKNDRVLRRPAGCERVWPAGERPIM